MTVGLLVSLTDSVVTRALSLGPVQTILKEEGEFLKHTNVESQYTVYEHSI